MSKSGIPNNIRSSLDYKEGYLLYKRPCYNGSSLLKSKEGPQNSSNQACIINLSLSLPDVMETKTNPASKTKVSIPVDKVQERLKYIDQNIKQTDYENSSKQNLNEFNKKIDISQELIEYNNEAFKRKNPSLTNIYIQSEKDRIIRKIENYSRHFQLLESFEKSPTNQNASHLPDLNFFLTKSKILRQIETYKKNLQSLEEKCKEFLIDDISPRAINRESIFNPNFSDSSDFDTDEDDLLPNEFRFTFSLKA